MATKRVVPVFRNPDKEKERRIQVAILRLKRKRMQELKGRKATRTLG